MVLCFIKCRVSPRPFHTVHRVLQARILEWVPFPSPIFLQVFPIVMYRWTCKLDRKEGWAPKNWCFQTVVLEKRPLDSKEIKSVNPKGNQPQIFIGGIDPEAEVLILWPPDAKSRLIGKDPDARKRLKAKGEGGNRGWDDSIASPTQWTWIWTNWEMVEDRGAWCASLWGHK